jgi:hypothetical protein
MRRGGARRVEFAISGVRYDEHGLIVERARVHEVRCSQIGPACMVSREQVIRLIQAGSGVVTTHLGADGNHVVGPEVILVP